jgi:hypothetical protein
MRILYLIFVLCVAALVGVAFAAARHIRRHEAKVGSVPDGQPSVGELTEDDLVPADKS